MNGWIPMLNLAFNDYNMSGENKLLLIVAQTKGTVLLVCKKSMLQMVLSKVVTHKKNVDFFALDIR